MAMMKWNLKSALLGSMLCWLSCSPAKKMPEGDLISIEYTTNACMAENEYEGSAERDSAGCFIVRSKKENYGPMYEKRIDASQMKHFRDIIEEEKMYLYKDSYKPSMEVMDGWGWHFHAKFSDGSNIWSGGSNASPDGNGLARVRAYMEELVKDGVLAEKDSIAGER